MGSVMAANNVVDATQHRILQRSDGGIVRALRYQSFDVSELHDALAGWTA